MRKVALDGTVKTVAGTGQRGYEGGGGQAIRASLMWPESIAVDSIGQVYLADEYGHRIRRIDSAGTITTVAGTGEFGYSGGGPAASAELRHPSGVAMGSDGTLYIGDSANQAIRKVDGDGIISSIAGTGRRAYNGEGTPATGFRLNNPTRVAAGPEEAV